MERIFPACGEDEEELLVDSALGQRKPTASTIASFTATVSGVFADTENIVEIPPKQLQEVSGAAVKENVFVWPASSRNGAQVPVPHDGSRRTAGEVKPAGKGRLKRARTSSAAEGPPLRTVKVYVRSVPFSNSVSHSGGFFSNLVADVHPDTSVERSADAGADDAEEADDIVLGGHAIWKKSSLPLLSGRGSGVVACAWYRVTYVAPHVCPSTGTRNTSVSVFVSPGWSA